MKYRDTQCTHSNPCICVLLVFHILSAYSTLTISFIVKHNYEYFLIKMLLLLLFQPFLLEPYRSLVEKKRLLTCAMATHDGNAVNAVSINQADRPLILVSQSCSEMYSVVYVCFVAGPTETNFADINWNCLLSKLLCFPIPISFQNITHTYLDER